MTPEKIGVVGAGSWGTALARLLSNKNHKVQLWAHRRSHAEEITLYRENRTYLPGFSIGKNLSISSDLTEVVRDKRFLVLAVPSHYFRSVFQGIVPGLTADKILVSAVKGIEEEYLMTMSQVMTEEMAAGGKASGIVVLTGPSFAREVAAEIPTAVTVASKNMESAQAVQELFGTTYFRLYRSSDLVGQELGAALKNIIAIATGISDGLGYGTNTRAALITRGLAEISRLGVKMGADPLTFSGLGGLGDLVLTCTGDLSRNRTVGLRLGQGKKLTDILKEMEMVAEGINTTKSAYKLALRQHVEMPILEQVYKILYEDRSCQDAVISLMTREQKEE
ncbi:MAG: NAD(P)H-dependent glycerol-3-phosphate dehydrogenase [Thermodesulfobacteriota bacterium]